MNIIAFPATNDVKLLPNEYNNKLLKRQNLWFRNGVFYIRKMVKGKRIVKSLQTNDPYLAVFLVTKYKENLMNKKLDIQDDNYTYEKHPNYQLARDLYKIKYPGKLITPDRIFNFMKEEGINLDTPNFFNTSIASPITKQEHIEKHTIMDIWTKNVKNQRQRAQKALDEILPLLPADTIEDIDENPDILLEFMDKMYDTPIKTGKNKGKYRNKKTILNYLEPLRQIIRQATKMGLIKNKDWIKEVLKLDLKKVKGISTKTFPFDEKDLPILFQALAKIHNHDFGFIQEVINNKSFKNIKASLERIIENPEALFYAVLIAFFTGSRATASITLQHKDIDINNKTISIGFDESDTEEAQKINKHKKLKGSIRTVPMAKILVDMGLITYLQEHIKKYDDTTPIFYEAIKTENDYREKYITESFNALLVILNIKPDKDSYVKKHYHSIKKCFYTYNRRTSDIHDLKVIAGNKITIGEIANDHYVMPTDEQLAETIQKLTYPGIEYLYK